MTVFPRIAVVAVGLAALPSPMHAQVTSSDASARQAYMEAVARHYHVSLAEIDVLSDLVGNAEDVPVLLFIASRAGVTPDVLGTLRRRGAGWDALARRFQVDPSSLVVPLGGDMAPRGLERVYLAYRRDARGLVLEDEEVVALVHLRMLAAILETSPAALAGRASWSGGYTGLLRTLRQDLP